MTSSHSRPQSPHHARWLVWLALLLLPLAQQLAYAHALTHIGSALSGTPLEDQTGGAAVAACATCLAAAPVAAGALPSATVDLPTVPAAHAPVLPPGEGVAVCASPSPYRSRAPPITFC